MRAQLSFFLTDIDPNAKVKGSRDPLGTQSVWSNVGRTVIGNLTTQTGLLTDFRVLVIGAYLEDLFRESLGELQAFLCWEQVAAYTRVMKGGPDDGFRGVTQARRRVPDVSRARLLFDWEPSVTLEEGLGLTYEWWKRDVG